MKFIDNNGIEYTITWQYEWKKQQRWRTICWIFDPKSDPLFYWGESRRMREDVDNKEFAKKKSLERALAKMTISKETRAEIWELYRTQTKQPRW